MENLIRSNIRTTQGMSLYDLRSLAQNEPGDFLRKIEEGASSGQLKLSDIRDIKAVWQALGDVSVQVSMPDLSGAQRTITTSAFPILTGNLVIAMINGGYNEIPKIGQDLVMEIDDPKKVTTIASVSALDSQKDEVKEREDFPEIGASEEKIEIRHRKNGRKLTLTAEALQENELANFTLMVNDLTKFIYRGVEKLTLVRVTDHYGSGASPAEPYVYRPNGTGTQLYNATANSPGPRAPLGTRINSNEYKDETDLENARIRLAGMKDNNGERIGAPDRSQTIILCPNALVGKISKTLNSEYVPGVRNEKSNWGPGGRFHIPVERLLSSPLMDDLSATAWYYGDPKSQFIRKWKMRFEYVSLGMTTQAYLNSQIAAQYRIAYDVEIGARDYVSMIQNLAATTAPVDE